jgi:hypothetical protein
MGQDLDCQTTTMAIKKNNRVYTICTLSIFILGLILFLRPVFSAMLDRAFTSKLIFLIYPIFLAIIVSFIHTFTIIISKTSEYLIGIMIILSAIEIMLMLLVNDITHRLSSRTFLLWIYWVFSFLFLVFILIINYYYFRMYNYV